MRKIDRDTTRRILDAADIVEVVSDFVTLKRRGANYIGLCPFHNERTPSFSVSKARGICKCFSCGKGGSPVNFLMELESMSFQEALRWLARKYHIEIKEHEESAEERAAEMERESMMAINQFAMQHFEDTMANTDDGRNIGLSYFRERGINDKMIERFHLGYALEKSDDLHKAATASGFSEKFLLSTGLCARSERGTIYDRYRGRVIYPVFSLSGRVVAFGARTLRKDKNVAKYVNSPESTIYKKSREVYGLYQSKQAIGRKDKCILVEGYMDVISMHQAGVENVVASSGTSLTEEQIRVIHRFTSNVTVIYDSDAAGIKASLRGIDMLLAQGINVKVLSLPDGDDPDSFAQSHTNTEVEAYLNEHETDFIRFKTDILLGDAGNDPIQRAHAINDIVRSISVIPDPITRNVYIDECARRFNITESVISLSVDKLIAEQKEADWKKQQHRQIDNESSDTAKQTISTPAAAEVANPRTPSSTTTLSSQQTIATNSDGNNNAYLQPFERELLRYVLRYGVMNMASCDPNNDENNDNSNSLSVIQYVAAELADDEIVFTNPVYIRTWNAAMHLSENWEKDAEAFEKSLIDKRKELMDSGIDAIRREATDINDIHARELRLKEDTDKEIQRLRNEYGRYYLERMMINDPDDEVRKLATDLVSDKYVLSKIYSKYAHIETDEERLSDLVPRALGELRHAILTTQISDIKQKIAVAAANGDNDTVVSLMTELMELNSLKSQFAEFLGDRIVTPLPRRK